MIKKFAGAVVTHLVAGMLLTVITSFGAELQKSYSNNLGNNELKVGYVLDVIDAGEDLELITFDIEGNIYTLVDYESDICKDDCCLMIINTRGTESLEDDIILDYRTYWDCDNNEYTFETNAEK